MGRCFVIQPFDTGAYDKRYEDVIVPAIVDAGLEDYRVDRDPTTKVLIEAIEDGIRSSDACIAEITTDCPNVWYELGFAIANNKPLVMICNTKERRGPFPFDVRHRAIVTYSPEAPRDFTVLQSQITSRLKAVLKATASTARNTAEPLVEGRHQRVHDDLIADVASPDWASPDPLAKFVEGLSPDVRDLFVALGVLKNEDGRTKCVSQSAEAFLASLQAHFIDRRRVYFGDWKPQGQPAPTLEQRDQFRYFGDWSATETGERPRLAALLKKWEQHRLDQWQHYRKKGVVKVDVRPSRMAQTAIAIIRADLADEPRFIMLANPTWRPWWFVGGGPKPQDNGDLGATVLREACEELALKQVDLGKPHSLGTTPDRRISRRMGLDTEYFYEIFALQIVRKRPDLLLLEGSVQTEERVERFEWFTWEKILRFPHLKKHANCVLRLLRQLDPRSIPKSGDLSLAKRTSRSRRRSS